MFSSFWRTSLRLTVSRSVPGSAHGTMTVPAGPLENGGSEPRDSPLLLRGQWCGLQALKSCPPYSVHFSWRMIYRNRCSEDPVYCPASRGEGECEPGHYRGQCNSALKKRTPSYSNLMITFLPVVRVKSTEKNTGCFRRWSTNSISAFDSILSSPQHCLNRAPGEAVIAGVSI